MHPTLPCCQMPHEVSGLLASHCGNETPLPLCGSLEVKASACNAGDLGSIPRLGSSPGGGNGNPLQDSCLENPMDRGAWWATVHRVAKSLTRLSDFTFTFPFPLCPPGWSLAKGQNFYSCHPLPAPHISRGHLCKISRHSSHRDISKGLDQGLNSYPPAQKQWGASQQPPPLLRG